MSLDEEKDVWRLRKIIKEKDVLISEIKENFFNLQKKYAKDIQNLIREKMELSLELKSLKPSLEKKDEFLEKYSQESIDKIKELNDKLVKIEKEWETRYHVVESRCKDLESKYLKDTEEKNSEILRLNRLMEDLEKKYEGEKSKNIELSKLKAKFDEFERDRLLNIKDPKVVGKIKELEEIINNKDKEIYDLKEKLNETSLKVRELSGTSHKIAGLGEKELQIKVIELNNEIESIKKELDFYQDKKINIIYFGEKQSIDCIKEIIKGTKRNALIFVPNYSQLEQLELTSLPSRVIIQAATVIDEKNKEQVIQLNRYRDLQNIKIRKYPPADMFAIVSDAAILFIGFLDEKNTPIGFKSTKSNLISFLGGLLKDTFIRFTEEFKS